MKKKVRGSRRSRARSRGKGNPKRKQVLLKTAEFAVHLDDLHRESKARFEAFVAANRALPCIERAEAWLNFTLLDEPYPLEFGDQEAAIYLASRGKDCAGAIQKINDLWRFNEQRVIRECAEDRKPINDLDGGPTRYRRFVAMGFAEARKIEERSELDLRDFWFGNRYQEQTIDATILRTVESCGIGGFDPWWKRLSQRTKRDFLDGGLEPGLLVYWLFAMSRSQLAIKLMPRALGLGLENLELVRVGSRPWKRWNPNEHPRGKGKPHYDEFEDLGTSQQ